MNPHVSLLLLLLFCFCLVLLFLSAPGQDSTIHFVRFERGGEVIEQRVRYALLPVSCLTFLSEKAVVGGGHDMNPLVFSADSGGKW